PAIASAVGLGEALTFFMELDHAALEAHEQDVLAYATERLAALEGVTLVGTAPKKVAVQSFLVEGAHPSDVGTLLDGFGVAVRTGHHCAQPVMERFGIPATARASFGLYNTREDVDALIEGLEQVQRLFGNA